MIKYFTYASRDEYGEHITPISDSGSEFVKTASLKNYSKEILDAIETLVMKPTLYYVVINAVGSFEVWGANGNGDSFPKAGLSHSSLRTDMGTKEDYGYKTFEYYAKLFKHHVNKPHSPSYGEVIFSHWNPVMDRVELIVGVDRTTGADIVASLEKGEDVSVSMGAKVEYDVCSICGNKAKTRSQYCKHVLQKLNKIVDENTAKLWSMDPGVSVEPGARVHTMNPYPRFFDISRVIVGADPTAHVLGKVASDNTHVHMSVDCADAVGVTDDVFDKVAAIGKQGEMEKQIPSAVNSVDGRVAKITKAKAINKMLSDKSVAAIEQEPEIDNSTLDGLSAKYSIGDIVKAMLSLGIFPKPREFQRMSLGSIGETRLADELDNRGLIFNYKSCGRTIPFTGGNSNNVGPASILSPLMRDRSFLPPLASPRIAKVVIVKEASQKSKMKIIDSLEPIAAMYDGIKKYASSKTVKDIATEAAKSPIAQGVLGVAALIKLVDAFSKTTNTDKVIDVPASSFENVLTDTNFSGMIDFSNEKQASQVVENIVVPGAYIKCASKQDAFNSGKPYIIEDWMSKQANINSFIHQASIDIENKLFN